MPLSCFLFRPRKSREKCRKRSHINASNASVIRTSTPSAQMVLRSLSHLKVDTHSALLKESHTAAHTPKQGLFRMGALLLPSERSARSQTSPGRVSERCTLPLLGFGRGCSRRRRGPAGLRDLFRFCRNCGLYALRSGPFRVCEARGGITTLSALYVLLKRRTAACQNGSFAVF